MQIIWTNCADEMPPDDSEIIIQSVSNGGIAILTTTSEIWFYIDKDNIDQWRWTTCVCEKL